MPSLKIFLNTDKAITQEDLDTFNDVVISGLDAQGEHAAVMIVPSAVVNLSGCYVELNCRHKPNRTPDMLHRLAEALDKTTQRVFGIKEPVRVRVIMLEEPLLAAAN